MKRFLPLSIGAVLVACSLLSCGNPQAGGVTDIGNSLALVLSDSSGNAIASARVVATRYQTATAGFISMVSLVDSTDEQGRIHFVDMAKGNWVLVAGDDSLSGIDHICFADDSTADTLRITVGKPKTLRGRFTDLSSAGVAFVPSVRAMKLSTDSSAQYTLVNVPPGQFPVCLEDDGHLYCRLAKTLDNRDTVDLRDMQPSLDSLLTPVVYPASQTPSYYLGKDFSGIALQAEETELLRITWFDAIPSGGLGKFPLVLHLDSSNFDFSLLPSTGVGLEIFDSVGSPLSFQIDTWDSANASALLWVRLDTVLAGQETQALWIAVDSTALLLQSGSQVFAAEDGFTAVYHFSENSLDSGDTIADVSGSGHSGIMAQDAYGRSGFLGQGLSFDGDSDRVELGTWDPCAQNFTVSLWVNWKGLNVNHQILFAKRYTWNPDSTRWQWHYDYLRGGFGAYQFDSLYRPVFPADSVPFGEWTYLTLQYRADEDSVFMWVNGSLVGMGSFVPGLATEAPLRLGGADAGEAWNGSMDEVRIEDVARSEDWIRLSWYTQKLAIEE